MEPERYLTLTGYTIAGHSTTARPDLAQELGFVGAKYPLAYGPADGDAGLKKNVETLETFIHVELKCLPWLCNVHQLRCSCHARNRSCPTKYAVFLFGNHHTA